ncbi:MAG: putative thiazole biosynthetic enzyme [Beijerinckiaceae bacterium]|nr:MAG: putative thiazole biosynthetic enzyme [Beijerinckiaceae bacterium]
MLHDVVIIGGGHYGLVCSAYLAMAGFKVVVLDQRPVVGGAAVTEEFSPEGRRRPNETRGREILGTGRRPSGRLPNTLGRHR